MSAPEQDVTWDAAKAQSNLAKHGVSFAQAATVLADPLALTVFDAAHSETEERWFTLGDVKRRKAAGGGAHVPANRAKPCPGAHDFGARGDAPRA